MDFNQLLYHHQIAIMNAQDAHKSGRFVHDFDMVQYYTKRINVYRADKGLSAGFVRWAAHSLDADKPSRQELSLATPTSAQPKFMASFMIASVRVNDASMGSMFQAVAAMGVSDILEMSSISQDEAQAASPIPEKRQARDNRPPAVIKKRLPRDQLEEWENEGGAQAVKARPSFLMKFSMTEYLATMPAHKNVHDMRAQALRDLLNDRNVRDTPDDGQNGKSYR